MAGDEGTKYSVIFSPEENAALEHVQKMPQFRGVAVSKRDAIRVAILGFEKLDVYADIMRELVGLRADLQNFQFNGVNAEAAAKKGPGRPANPKLTDSQKREQAVQVCSALGGTLDGEMCMYKKREITAIGKPAEYEVGVDLLSLSQENIDTQYYPNREEWEAADRKYNPK